MSSACAVSLRVLRVANARDEDVQVRFWTSLSPDSSFTRFFTSNPNAFRALSNDPAQRTVVLAELGAGNVVGLGELLYLDDRVRAEVAFAVLDGHQGRGLGRRLLAELADVGRERGLQRFVASVLPFNRAMLSVFRRSGLRCEVRQRSDVYELTLDLALPMAQTMTAAA